MSRAYSLVQLLYSFFFLSLCSYRSHRVYHNSAPPALLKEIADTRILAVTAYKYHIADAIIAWQMVCG